MCPEFLSCECMFCSVVRRCTRGCARCEVRVSQDGKEDRLRFAAKLGEQNAVHNVDGGET